MLDVAAKTRGGQILNNCWAWLGKVNGKLPALKYLKYKIKGWIYPVTYNPFDGESLGMELSRLHAWRFCVFPR